MADANFPENDTLQQIAALIEENLSNEQFGVSELARAAGMSRSNLLRKIKKITHLSASQLIRQIRLERGMELLKQTSLTVSEISFQVGFKSPSYFIKCFREHYGYSPGEAENRNFDESQVQTPLGTHRLAAIMFTDIQGYTALMQQDEEKAIRFRNRHREIFNTATEKYRGEILQYFGDGTLSIFSSAIDAVKCGIELQLGFRSTPAIPVRIGIHSGDIIVNKEEIIGDGVNVASRIESLATAGSVLISGKVFDEVKNQRDISCTSLGSFAFKNVDRPVAVYALANPGLVVPTREQLSGKLKRGSQPGDHSAGFLKKGAGILIALITLLLIAGGSLLYRSLSTDAPFPDIPAPASVLSEKSIAVLPFINDSDDSTNVYIINGLMESILNHLQKIEDLRVVSRTSVEQYRNHTKVLPEIARELNVHYLVEGSGQKLEDQILLNIQLIDGTTDQHLWSEQYDRATADIFQLQKEVAQKIAAEIEAVITPEEAERLEEIPTENLEAYEYFLKGREHFYAGTAEDLKQALSYYERAIELDPEFARAYAGMAIAYYFLDYFYTGRQYSEQINYYADQAVLYDAQSPQSLIAKALFYLQGADYTAALPHLEKALEYHPNSALVINILSDYYTRFVPNTRKYLEYALKGIDLDIAAKDAVSASYIYLHISNAFIQSGFVQEAEQYINKSLNYNPENWYAAYLKAFIGYARDQDLLQTQKQLIEILKVDSLRLDVQLDVLQEIGKISYYRRDYETAYRYYEQYIRLRDESGLDKHPVENMKIAMVMRKMGHPEAAALHLKRFEQYTEQDQSIYRELNQAMIAAYQGKPKEALQLMQQFSEQTGYHYWILLFLHIDPILDETKELPAFRETIQEIEHQFWREHAKIRKELQEQQLLGSVR